MAPILGRGCPHAAVLSRKRAMASITDRIDNVTRIPPAYLNAALPAPKSVKIEISPRCNYRCGFCALRTREVQPKWDMDFGLFKRITREMRDAGVGEIGVFYLGESFMNPRLLVDCIAWLKRDIEMPYVFLTSNASMAFAEALEECMKAGLDSLKWSVNAAAFPAGSASARGRYGSWKLLTYAQSHGFGRCATLPPRMCWMSVWRPLPGGPITNRLKPARATPIPN